MSDHDDWPPVPDTKRRCEGCGLPVADDEDNAWHAEHHPDCEGGCGLHLCWCSEECEEDIDWRGRYLAVRDRLPEALFAIFQGTILGILEGLARKALIVNRLPATQELRARLARSWEELSEAEQNSYREDANEILRPPVV